MNILFDDKMVHIGSRTKSGSNYKHVRHKVSVTRHNSVEAFTYYRFSRYVMNQFGIMTPTGSANWSTEEEDGYVKPIGEPICERLEKMFENLPHIHIH